MLVSGRQQLAMVINHLQVLRMILQVVDDIPRTACHERKHLVI